MTTPDTKNGITKDSTLLINVNPYLPNNYKQTLNYVGYWKWDSTNQTFIQVLNNQDIIDEKYNLKIQPLFYDADTGLPQKVTVNSGDTKRLKMVNDNNDGSMEPAEYIENNTMVKFNSKTRAVTEYPYFEVEALPPTISTPIENNGYYKFNGNNTLINGTSSDYNLNVQVNSKINITKFLNSSNGTPILLKNMYYNGGYSVSLTSNKILIHIYRSYSNNGWMVICECNQSSYTNTVSLNTGYYYILNYVESNIYLLDENDNKVCIVRDENTINNAYSSVMLYDNFFNLSFN